MPTQQRYFLAEILKDSQIPSGTLLQIIQGERIRPRWMEIALPQGRSVTACQKAYDSLYARVFHIPLHTLGPAPLPSPSPGQRKRPSAGAEVQMSLNRELQPRGPGFTTIKIPPEPTASAYPVALADPGDQRKKKRGRPSKAEAEMKAAEYAARGEPYPPPRKSKNPKLSSEGTNTAGAMGSSIMFTPVTMGPAATEGPSSGTKRATKASPPQDSTIPNYSRPPATPQQVYGGDVTSTGQPVMFSQASPPGTMNTSIRPVEERGVEGNSKGHSRQANSKQASPAENVTLGEQKSFEPGNEVNDIIVGPMQQQSMTELSSSEATVERKGV
ncbi:MAG: hypothetical protein Q9168_001758 [Polycauliona sp. 1 TL-2023]